MKDQLFIATDKKSGTQWIMTKKHLLGGDEHGTYCVIDPPFVLLKEAVEEVRDGLEKEHKLCTRVNEFMKLIHYDLSYEPFS